MTCSGEQKVTTIVLKVDLDCYQCYRKIKRSLCRFPQIRNQIFDEKQNIVTITVVCCSPDRILDKLCAKAGKTIKGIHVVKPGPPKKPDSDPPKPAQPKAPAPAPAPAPEAEKPKAKPAPEAQPPAPAPEKPAVKKNGSKNGSKSEPAPAPAPAPKAAAEEKAPAPKAAAPAPAPAAAPTPAPAQAYTEPMAQWVPGYPPGPPPQVYPVAVYCTPGYDQGGYGPGPGFYQYGRPACPPGYYGNRCDYFSEENPTACSIM